MPAGVMLMSGYESDNSFDLSNDYEQLRKQQVLYGRIENIERMVVLIGIQLEQLEKHIKDDISLRK